MIKESVTSLLFSLLASAFAVVLGIIYFGIILWVVKMSSNLFFGPGLEANWAVFSSALLAVGALLTTRRR